MRTFLGLRNSPIAGHRREWYVVEIGKALNDEFIVTSCNSMAIEVTNVNERRPDNCLPNSYTEPRYMLGSKGVLRQSWSQTKNQFKMSS
jgi:hypothetical protein